jgi:sugar/nucleoside kinase (ribokinase family)
MDAFDVVTIGNALVDVLAHADDDGLAALGLDKGSWGLLSEVEDADRLYARMPPSVEVSGGCAANTAAGVVSMGGRAAYIGKVRDDQLGTVFRHDIRAAGVAYDLAPTTEGPATGRCLILVSPDGQRTMRPYLGAAHELTAADVDRDVVASAQVTYLEGFLWDPPGAKDAFRTAIDAAHGASRMVAFSLSDVVCIANYREEFLELLQAGAVDVLFGNEDEALALTGADSMDAAAKQVQQWCRLSALTLGPAGSLVVTPDGWQSVPAEPVERVVDTTGAGDLYAAGFLYGLTHGADPVECGRLGGVAAAEVISHVGARPEVALATLI